MSKERHLSTAISVLYSTAVFLVHIPDVLFPSLSERLAPTCLQRFVSSKASLKSALHLIEVGLWILAAATLGYCGYTYGYAALHQHREKTLFTELRTRDAREASFLGSAAIVGTPFPGKLLGILDIPRIGLSTIVEQGTDSAILRLSVGHIPGTALPGESGNVALAAHRDTYFRHLSKLRPGDLVIFRTISGVYRYTVQSTRVVAPSDTAVLDPTSKPTLTLITCFPFYYVGSAPKRFILVATLHSPAAAPKE